MVEQLALPFEPLTGRDRLVLALKERHGDKVILELTENRRRLLSAKQRRGVLYVRADKLFADAPPAVHRAVATYFGPTPKNEGVIDAWVNGQRDKLEQRRKLETPIRPGGRHHDLAAILDAENRRHFEAELELRITWSRATKKKKRQSMQLGAYCPEQHLIRIHPALDQAFVPQYFVRAVVFHEMLHHVIGPEAGRVHTPAFDATERAHPDYDKSRRWEAQNLKRLLRY